MPRVIFVDDGRDVALEGNATLARALEVAGRRDRTLLIEEGADALTPPTPRERRRFGEIDWHRRIPDQAGIIGEATICVRGA